MKAFPTLKLLTAVTVLLFTLGAGAQEKPAYRNRQECKAEKVSTCLNTCESEQEDRERKLDKKSKTYNDELDTIGDIFSSCKKKCEPEKYANICSPYPDEAESREGKTDCKTAMDKYYEASGDGDAACAAFTDEAGRKSCAEKVRSCESQITGVMSGGSDEETTDDTYGLLSQMIVTGLKANTANPQAAGLCVEHYDTKAMDAAQEKFDRRKKELNDDIKKQKDKLAELNRKKREKQADIEKEIAKIEKANKQEKLEKETKIREQIAALSKSSVETGKRLRSFNLAITQEKQKLSRLQLSHQNALMELTSDKVTRRCQQTVMALKNKILASGTIDPKDPTSEQIKAVAEQFRGKGIKGTGDLKAFLIQTKDACFQSENSKKQNQTMGFNQEKKNIEDRITEIQNEINDEKKRVSLDQENIQKIQQENTNALTAEEEAKLKEVGNLNKEMMDFATSNEEEERIANEEGARLTAELQQLVLEKNTNSKPAFIDAKKAINKAERARESAYTQCRCDDFVKSKDNKDPKATLDPRIQKSACTNLEEAETKGAGKKKPKTSI